MPDSPVPAPPRGTRAAGRRLWRAVLEGWELQEHELALLRQAVRVVDVCEALHRLVDDQGPLLADRVHPALVELRQQRVLLARLIVALRVPLGEAEEEPAVGARTQRRATRGVYAIRPGVA